MEQEKEITISSLSHKTISPKPGQSWRAFNVYQIQGNDGITYETTDQNYYNALTVGKVAKIKYKSETKTVNGRVYTSYKIALPAKPNPAMDGMLKELKDQLTTMEKNILAAIELSCGAPRVVMPGEPTPSVGIDEPDEGNY